MSPKSIASWSFVLASLLIGGACGGDDAEPSAAAEDADTDVSDDDTASPAEDDSADESDEDVSGDDTAVGFGELMEGSFIFTGAIEERYYVSDDELAFRLGGGCQGDQFGFSIAITDAAGEVTLAMVNAQVQADLAGGQIGEFDVEDAEVAWLPDGDITLVESYEGTLRMVISEHNTGGASADLNARRMSVTLLGTVTGDKGDVDVDVTFRWVMGCP